MSDLPPDVLNDPAFSGKVANLLVTTTDAPIVPLCGEFEDLVAGRVCVYLCSICWRVHVRQRVHTSMRVQRFRVMLTTKLPILTNSIISTVSPRNMPL
jgi:hypothetical protein